jgi:predicted nucleic acid-binding protein
VTAARISPVYLDTSCAVRLFLNEAQEKGAQRLAERLSELQPVALFSSSLLIVEWHSAFRAKLRGGAIGHDDYVSLCAAWDDFAGRRVDFWPISDAVIESARGIVTTSVTPGRVRSLDCIHLATCLQVRDLFPETVLFSADTVMCALAAEHGLPFFNPLGY